MSKLKKVLFSVLILLLITPTVSFAVDSVPQDTVQTEITNEITPESLESDIAPEESIKTTPMTGEIDAKGVKSPYENDFQEKTPKQNEFTRMIFMFLKVMMAVAICSVIIYIVLLGVRKFYGTATAQITDEKKIEDNLKSTQNENEALKIFLNKTKNQ